MNPTPDCIAVPIGWHPAAGAWTEAEVDAMHAAIREALAAPPGRIVYAKRAGRVVMMTVDPSALWLFPKDSPHHPQCRYAVVPQDTFAGKPAGGVAFCYLKPEAIADAEAARARPHPFGGR